MTDQYLDLTKVKDIKDLNEKDKITAYVTFFRVDLYNRGFKNDSKAIHAKMCEYDIKPMPSVSKIKKILKNQCLTNGRTGYYEGDYR